MHVLYYWKYYWQDWGRGSEPDFTLIQSSPAMEQLVRGDSVWAFCRDKNGRYVPAAELVVAEVEARDPPLPYGRFVARGDSQSSRYFDVERCPSIEATIRTLSVKVQGEVLGYSFQGRNGVRVLAAEDHEKLKQFCARLPLIHSGQTPPQR